MYAVIFLCITIEVFDRDGNGRIDRSEFRRAMNDLGIDLSSSELTRVIRKFDRDGDGAISPAELHQVVLAHSLAQHSIYR